MGEPTVRIDELRTPRLVLRRWREDDLAPFAALNADPRVAEFLPSTLTRDESDAMVGRLEAHHDERGFGLWCVEPVDRADGDPACVGFVGLARWDFDAPFMPAVEVGWRLSPSVWGRGYATEGAAACLDAAFGPLGLDEVVSFTVPANVRSRAVMELLGMVHDPDGDFEHPRVAEGSPLRRHVLYRIDPQHWADHRRTVVR